MKRRTFIVGFGASVVGYSTLFGSGAFDTVRADREVAVDVVPDSDAYLSIESIGSGGRSSNGDSLGSEAVTFRFPGADFKCHPENMSPGLGTDSVYEFTRDKDPNNPEGLAVVKNQGTQTVEITDEQDETAGPKIGIFNIESEIQSNGFRPLLRESPVSIAPGDSFRIGVQVDTHGVEISGGEGPDGEYVETVRITATSEENL